ncbi:MAG: TolC family protein [Magnetococcales bacterium]|nr:TolC family protein [Magnetococcales bacterium]
MKPHAMVLMLLLAAAPLRAEPVAETSDESRSATFPVTSMDGGGLPPPSTDESRSATFPVNTPVGASVAELLERARALNPELAAAALEAEAAQARVRGADALADPSLQVTFDEISENAAGWPGRTGTYKYTLQQEIPWWGKRGLRRSLAEAESREFRSRQAETLAEVAMQVKVAYADYHRVHLAMDQSGELLQVLRALVEFAQFRYAQGQGGLQEATGADAERGALSAELVRLEKERHRLRARLNALVDRPPDAPLVEHPTLRPLPAPEALAFDKLLEHGLAANPALAMGQARLEAAGVDLSLAAAEWFPDVELGFGLVDRRAEGARNGYEAMVALNLPLQWEPRRAREQEAAARQQAARERLNAERRQVEAGLREALLSLEEARQIEQVTRESLLPQARIAMQSALKSYETGGAEAVAVLDAVQRLKRFQIELIEAQFEQQVRLAEIERFIGGEL